jgi:hypothetical protein
MFPVKKDMWLMACCRFTLKAQFSRSRCEKSSKKNCNYFAKMAEKFLQKISIGSLRFGLNPIGNL